MELERDPQGDLWFRKISPLYADTLIRLPEWLGSEDPRVRERLFPPVYEDPEDEAQWRKYGLEELEHLFASRSEIVAKDLESLAADDEVSFSLRIRQKHAAAWLSSLNGARLALFALHGLAEADIEGDPADIDDFEKELALVRIHIMAYMQELLLDGGGLGS